MSYKDLTPAERITATHVAFMRDADFSLLAGTCMIGKSTIVTDMPTAATDGRDKMYGEAFVARLTMQQLRYLVAHENLHVMLRHCTEYNAICRKYPQESNMAQDYCITGMIEEMDNGRGFVQRPTDPAPLIDVKYKGMSWLEILQDLLKNPPPPNPQGGKGQPQTLDQHIQSTPGSGEPGAMTEAEGKELAKQVQDAINQGAIMQTKLRGDKAGGAKLSGFQERKTDWRTPLRKFISEICEGDEQSRFNPPNRRMQASGFLLPSHFSESTGEIIIACDTSGSMGGVYPLVFGEVARICQTVTPESVRVIWWDTEVAGVQRFLPKDYPQIGKVLAPEGGGGTVVSCVADYIAEHKLKPKACIMISDGYIESSYRVPDCPMLWGIVDNANFSPRKGKVLHLSSLQM